MVALLWAAIYLPGLGSTEIKGEEGRRILPAVTMLDEGDWLVPQVGGKPFLRKPPLVNWMIAGSFKMLNRRDEWAAEPSPGASSGGGEGAPKAAGPMGERSCSGSCSSPGSIPVSMRPATVTSRNARQLSFTRGERLPQSRR